MTPLQKVAGIGPTLATALANRGIATAEQLAAASPDILQDIPRLGALRAQKLLTAARSVVSGDAEQGPASTDAVTVEASDSPMIKVVGKTRKTPKGSAKADKKASDKSRKASDKKSKAKTSKAEKPDAEKAEIKKSEKKKSVDDKAKKKTVAKATKAAPSKKTKSVVAKKDAKAAKSKASKTKKK